MFEISPFYVALIALCLFGIVGAAGWILGSWGKYRLADREYAQGYEAGKAEAAQAARRDALECELIGCHKSSKRVCPVLLRGGGRP